MFRLTTQVIMAMYVKRKQPKMIFLKKDQLHFIPFTKVYMKPEKCFPFTLFQIEMFPCIVLS